jgi:hypothetical protein
VLYLLASSLSRCAFLVHRWLAGSGIENPTVHQGGAPPVAAPAPDQGAASCRGYTSKLTTGRSRYRSGSSWGQRKRTPRPSSSCRHRRKSPAELHPSSQPGPGVRAPQQPRSRQTCPAERPSSHPWTYPPPIPKSAEAGPGSPPRRSHMEHVTTRLRPPGSCQDYFDSLPTENVPPFRGSREPTAGPAAATSAGAFVIPPLAFCPFRLPCG